MTPLLPVDEAIARIIVGAAPVSSDYVALAEAAGRTLAEPLKARRTQPPFDASSMDGYAVRAADTAHGAGNAEAGRHVRRRPPLRRHRRRRARRCASSPARRCRPAPTPSSSRRTPRPTTTAP